MSKLGGFWSYVHSDDEAESSRITDLAGDLAQQYEMITNESIKLFLDKDVLKWGDDWKGKVDQSLGSVAFFIPVLTPRYFQSAECTRELRFFAEAAQKLGLKELVLPLLYHDFAALHEQQPADDLIVTVRKFQWEDWTDVRFEERQSGVYRKRVAALAQRLVDANATVIARPVSVQGPADGETDIDDDAPGFMDLIATAEEIIPVWKSTINGIGTVIEDLGNMMKSGTEQITAADKRGKGFAGRVQVFRHLARELADPADEILRLASDYAQQLIAVDSGITALIELADPDTASDTSQGTSVNDYLRVIRQLSENSSEAMSRVGGILTSMEPVESASRDLRPVLRKYRRALTDMTAGTVITDAWVGHMDAKGLGLPEKVEEPSTT